MSRRETRCSFAQERARPRRGTGTRGTEDGRRRTLKTTTTQRRNNRTRLLFLFGGEGGGGAVADGGGVRVRVFYKCNNHLLSGHRSIPPAYSERPGAARHRALQLPLLLLHVPLQLFVSVQMKDRERERERGSRQSIGWSRQRAEERSGTKLTLRRSPDCLSPERGLP